MPKTAIEIRDIDNYTTATEVEASLKNILSNYVDDIKFARRGQIQTSQ